jgi:hypothetical protein
MRVCARIANRVLTGDERSDLLGCLDVRVREQVRICPQDRLGPVAEPSCDDVKRDAVGQRERRVRVPEDVQCPRRDPGRFAVAPEPFGQPLRMDRAAGLVAEDEVLVDVGLAGERALEQLRLTVSA